MSGAFDGFTRPNGTYLLNHSVGVPPRSTQAFTSNTLVADWMTDPADAWPRWEAELEGFHTELAQLCNHASQWFCHQVNVSSALTKILHSLPVQESRPSILLSERSFPSLGYVVQAASAVGYRAQMIPRTADTANPATWDAALSSDIGIVLVDHAESNTGTQLPVAEIVGEARAAGAIIIVDVAQSAGVLPIDLAAWQADFVIGTSVKWIGGGPGAGFLWVNPAIIDRCQPVDVGWFSHEAPFELDIRNFRYAPDARRFWGGTPSPIPAALARHALATINAIGIEQISAHNRALTQQLVDGVPDRMLASPHDAARRSGTVVIEPGSDRRADVLSAFAEAGVQVDERLTGIRVSPHVVNDPTDIDLLLAVLQDTTTP